MNNMRRSKAIQKLREERDMLNDLNFSDYENWERRNKIRIKIFFGENSPQYKNTESLCIDNKEKGIVFSFKLSEGIPVPDPETIRKQQKEAAKKFLTDCIADLQAGEVYLGDSKWLKWIKEPENRWKIFAFLLTTTVSIIAAIITVLKYVNSIKD